MIYLRAGKTDFKLPALASATHTKLRGGIYNRLELETAAELIRNSFDAI